MILKPLTLGAIAATAFNIANGATILAYDGLLTPTVTPAGNDPWLTAEVETLQSRLNNLGQGTYDLIQIDITANLGDSTEFISKAGLTIPDNLDPADFSIVSVTPTGFTGIDSVDFSSNTFNTGADTEVGFLVNFNQSNSQGGINRFNGDDSVSFVVRYDGDDPISAETFLTDETFGAAHIQGIGGENSTWASNVPEPSTALLSSLAAIGLLRRKR